MKMVERRGAASVRLWIAPGEPSRRLGLAALCVALVAVFGFAFDGFFTPSNALTTALNLSSITIAGIGTALLLISGNVDLSIGAQWALGGMVVGQVAVITQNAVAPVVVGLLFGATVGLVNGLLVRWLAISPLIVTLGASLVYTGLAFAVSKGYSVYGFSADFVAIGAGRPFGVPIPVIVATVIFVILGVALVGSRMGLRVYAIGGNPEAAARNGVPVGRSVVGLFTLNGVLISIVSILTVSRLNTASPQIGVTFALDVLTAVILGGVAFAGGQGHPLGVILGIVTIGILDTGLVFVGVEDWWQQVARGIVLVGALVIDQLAARARARRRFSPTPTSAIELTDEKSAIKLSDEQELEAPTPTETAEAAARRVTDRVALECAGLAKSYGPVVAVRNAGFAVNHGEIVCLVGDNGAGKSTVVKMISGTVQPDAGTVRIGGVQATRHTAASFRDEGVHTVYQDLAICANLSVAHNLVLGEEPLQRFPLLRWLGIRDDRRAEALAAEKLARVGSTLKGGRQLIRDVSGGQRQSVAIARALRPDTKVMILDEPTAALGVRQTARVLDTVRAVARSGAGVILITHDVETVLAVADRIVVMREGAVAFDGPRVDLSQSDLVHLMAGLKTAAGHASPGVSP